MDIDGEIVFTTHVAAVPARPFFRPAWDTEGVPAYKKVGRALQRGLDRETKKLVGSFSKSGLRGRR